jgi:predicted SnoaL-like aldol condensation-catalyzing enzyme
MGTAAEERNKAQVLEAFDTLVSKRDYAAAQRFWSHSDVIQHGATAEQSKSGLPMFDHTFPTPWRP